MVSSEWSLGLVDECVGVSITQNLDIINTSYGLL